MILYLFNTHTIVAEEPDDVALGWLDRVQASFTMYKPGYRFMAAFKHGKWDGKEFLGELLVTKSGTRVLKFGRGMRKDLYRVLKIVTGDQFDIVDNREPRFVLDPDIYDDEVLRWYQREAIVAAVERYSGLIVLPTGAGKTEVAVNLVSYAGNPKTLFLVNEKDLVDNALERFEKYNIPVRRFDVTDESPTTVQVSTVQKVHYYHKKYQDSMQEFYDGIDCVIVDEAHHAKSPSYQQVLSGFKTPHIYGLTATPEETTKHETVSVISNVGPIIYRKTLADLAKGTTAILVSGEVEMKNMVIDPIDDWKSYSDLYERGIVRNEFRNKTALEWVLNGYDEHFTLIFVSRVEHGENLSKLTGGKIPFVYGNTPERHKWIQDMRDGKINAFITTVMKEGVDIPRLTRIVNLEGGASPRPVTQKAGRAVRKFEGKEGFHVLDFYDRGERIFENHAKARLKQYKILGFDIKMTI